MNPQPSALSDDAPAPLPGRTFKVFMAFFHVCLVGGLTASLAFALWEAQDDLGWEQAVLALCVAMQIVLYLRSFATLRSRTPPGWFYPAYFMANLAIWVCQTRISSFFNWVICCYFGQLLAAVPPRRSLPLAAVYLAVVVELLWGWRTVAGMKSLQILVWGASATSWIAVGLFIHHLAKTSGERAKLIVELEAARREIENARQRDAEVAALRERERLARELHDSLGHSLVTITVQLEAIQRLYPVDQARASALLDELKSLTRSGTEDLRRTLANLRTPGLGERKLSEALKEFVDELGPRALLGVDLRLPAEADQFQPLVAEALWRVAQEALTNVVKHAVARRATVTLALEPRLAVLRVEDDGAGLPADAERRPGHFGLRGLRERVEGLGGTLILRGEANRGTVVEARLPIC